MIIPNIWKNKKMFRTTNQDVWIIAIGLGILDRNCDVDSDDGPSKQTQEEVWNGVAPNKWHPFSRWNG